LAAIAAQYRFTNVVDTLGPFQSFPVVFTGGLSINNAGSIVFPATLDDGTRGVFTAGDDGQVVTIVDSSGEFLGFECSMNDDGIVAFAASLDSGGSGIFKSVNGEVDTIVLAGNGQAYPSVGSPVINSAGDVAFILNSGTGGSDLYLSRQGIIAKAADNVSWPISMSDSGLIAFKKDVWDGGVFVTDGGDPIAIEPEPASFPSINSHGAVAYTHYGVGNFGIYSRTIDSPRITIADRATFASIGPMLEINDRGTVVFEGLPRDRLARGIFTGDDLPNETVIRNGDPLLGSTLRELYEPVINDRGQIAFQYWLTNGVRGIALATPMPGADFNVDGIVDGTDFLSWQRTLGTTVDPSVDPDGDGVITAADLAIWKEDFGSRAASVLASPVPEPVAGVLLVALALAALPFKAYFPAWRTSACL
jgi:hypothetical protein